MTQGKDQTTVPDTIKWKRDYLSLVAAIDLLQKQHALHPKIEDALGTVKGLLFEEIMGGIDDDD